MIPDYVAIQYFDHGVPRLERQNARIYSARIGHSTPENPRKKQAPARDGRQAAPEREQPMLQMTGWWVDGNREREGND
jgi:hypothetical protein